MPKARVTIEDVARACHVSVATVSMVLSGKPGINAMTRKRVASVAQTMGYQRRIRISEKPLRRIAVVVDQTEDSEVVTSGFVQRLIAGAAEIIEKLRIQCDVVLVERTMFIDEELTNLAQRQFDAAMVIATEADREVNARLLDLGIPVVLVGMFSDTLYADAVQINHYSCMYDLVTHIVSTGHQRIGMIGGQDSFIPNLRYRYHGFLHAMYDHGLDATHIVPCTRDTQDIRSAAAGLLDSYPEMTAIVCRDDVIARVVLQVLKERNIAVPGRMTVTGFGDITASVDDEALTTVQIDAHTMGMLAVNVMMNRLRVPAMMPITAVIHAPLCIRATSGPPRQSS